MTQDSRRVLIVCTNDPRSYQQALACARSLKLIGDQIPRYLVGIPATNEWNQCFTQTLPPENLADLSSVEGEHLLFLHSNVLAFKRLNPVFEACEGSSICVQQGFDKVAEVGMIYIRNSADGRAAYADYVNNQELPVILPRGDHLIASSRQIPKLDVRANICELLTEPDSKLIKPHLWHALGHDDHPAYQREMAKLAKLAVVEARMSRGQITTWLKTRRSVERRILKLRGKL